MSSSVVSQVSAHAERRPHEAAFTYLVDGETRELVVSYAQLKNLAAHTAHQLRARVPAGSRVLLAFPPGTDFIAAFIGCLGAGIIAVPVAVPRMRDGAAGIARLDRIAKDSGAALIVSSPQSVETETRLRAKHACPTELPRYLFDAEATATADFPVPQPSPEDIAFLQYTSGSTSDPKGVVVRHRNLVANFDAIGPAMGLSAASTFLSWLPLHHDMGLIGIVLQALYLGARLILFSPAHFMQRPMRWPAAISRYRATLSGAPDFAYDLCVRQSTFAERARLDLRCWDVAFNGSEPVRATTIDAFTKAFSVSGFRPEAMFPCYGLAEATLYAAGARERRGARIVNFDTQDLAALRANGSEAGEGTRLVASGYADAEHDLRIVDPETCHSLPDGHVGEIWLAGPSICDGYWNKAASAGVFQSRIDDGPARYLRTGDLGFLLGGQVFVTGRRKDLIILRGRNIYPQDIEYTAQSLGAAGAAAFGEEIGSETRLILVCEVFDDAQDMASFCKRVAEQVLVEHEIRAHRVIAIRRGLLPRTSSGKVRRSVTRQSVQRSELPTLAEYRDESNVVSTLKEEAYGN